MVEKFKKYRGVKFWGVAEISDPPKKSAPQPKKKFFFEKKIFLSLLVNVVSKSTEALVTLYWASIRQKCCL